MSPEQNRCCGCEMRKLLYGIMQLNMSAIEHKNAIAKSYGKQRDLVGGF